MCLYGGGEGHTSGGGAALYVSVQVRGGARNLGGATLCVFVHHSQVLKLREHCVSLPLSQALQQVATTCLAVVTPSTWSPLVLRRKNCRTTS